MAGGSGTRFWPMSRRSFPKQFLALAGEKSLLRTTFERLEPLVGTERLWVVSGVEHVALVRKEIPELSPSNILGEPAARNTAPCIGLAAQRVLEREADARILVSPSDHMVEPAEAFRDAVVEGLRVLDTSPGGEPWTVTFGIIPRYPATGFGYIERGSELGPGEGSLRPYLVARFKEKPALETAREYVESGRFYWNSGIFLWKAGGLLRLIDEHIPLLAEGLREIGDRARGSGGLEAALGASFAALPSISIDYGVLERAANVAVLPAAFEWDDVGSWRAVERYAPRDKSGNSTVGHHIAIDSRNCTFVGQKRLIGAIGVENLVVVETDDAVLVCSRDQTERVKEIVDRMRKEGLADLT
ncbi:MAG TPA: mannose-1-phosphate guanylyltransferase [Planctomycetota bacterium]|nr:mannose-1-phosphate guanylyltransferase [Planctomycetota bacterium]